MRSFFSRRAKQAEKADHNDSRALARATRYLAKCCLLLHYSGPISLNHIDQVYELRGMMDGATTNVAGENRSDSSRHTIFFSCIVFPYR